MSLQNHATSSSKIQITGSMKPEFEEILTQEALTFLTALAETFTDRIESLLAHRKERQERINAGEYPDFLEETASIRAASWQVGPVPSDLRDRRVEITGPVDRKMVINALNSGAKVFMADFEDAHSPTWEGTMAGQINMRDAVRGTISFTSKEGKHYALQEKIATLIVRPRGWHLREKHILVNGKPIYGALCDFGLFFFHNAHALLKKGSGPYFYLPKLEHYLEARLWNDVFVFAQKYLSLPVGTIKATVLIETILAAFQMEEILYELRDHVVALNCGRWDYIFSCIKKFHANPAWVLPDRSQVTMNTHFLRSYYMLLIKTCHKRNAYAMGGMAAQIPIKDDPKANEEAFAKVRADKEREASAGHDGTWVAHPGLVPVAMEVFNRFMPGPNQLDKQYPELVITAEDLLAVPEGKITEEGVRNNVSVSIQYIESWLRGMGCVPIFHLMEDAATAEISRSQLWQWIHHAKGVLSDGRKVTVEMVRAVILEELEKIKAMVGEERYAKGKYREAARIVDDLVTRDNFAEFLTLPALEHLD